MNKEKILIYYGEGRGKSASALGHALRVASQGKSVIIIQFLKGKNEDEMSFIRRLEPEIKFFRFEKSEEDYNQLSEAEQKEEYMNIMNGVHFAKKVLLTGECNVLILDEFLGLLDNHVISEEDIKAMLAAKADDTEIIFTGRFMDESFIRYADEIYCIRPEKMC
jgi:cob(I)alamin adenosyltransferase